LLTHMVFKDFVKDIAMQVAATNPIYLSREEVPKEVLDKEREIEMAKLEKDNKPKDIVEKIIEGKLEKYFAEVCLLDQVYIKDDKLTVSDLLNEKRVAIGEKIEIRRFTRYELGN
jgi:elongation factor Ts